MGEPHLCVCVCLLFFPFFHQKDKYVACWSRKMLVNNFFLKISKLLCAHIFPRSLYYPICRSIWFTVPFSSHCLNYLSDHLEWNWRKLPCNYENKRNAKPVPIHLHLHLSPSTLFSTVCHNNNCTFCLPPPWELHVVLLLPGTCVTKKSGPKRSVFK